jgi:DNA repair protein RadD
MLRPTESVSLYQQIVGGACASRPARAIVWCSTTQATTSTCSPPKWGAQAPRRHRAGAGALPRLRLCQHLLGQDRRGWQGDRALRPPLSGLFEDDEGNREECDYRFRAKICPACGAENDIAARRCQSCDQLLVDPDDKLKEALNLKDCMVIRCAGLTLSAGRGKQGERLEVTYHDEDGLTSMSTSLSLPGCTALVSTTLCASSLARPGPGARIHTLASVMLAAKPVPSPGFRHRPQVGALLAGEGENI